MGQRSGPPPGKPCAGSRPVTGVIALAAVLGTGALVVLGLLLHRDLGRITRELARSGHQPTFQRDLDQLWADTQRLVAEGSSATDKRMQEAEVAISEVKQHQRDLARYVNWMLPLVQRWTGATSGGGR